MGSLKRFLDRDPAAKAVLLAVLGTAPIPAAADAIKVDARPVAARVSGESMPGAVLVALDVERIKLAKVVELMKSSTNRCLADQDRLLHSMANTPASPQDGKVWLKAARETRMHDLYASISNDAKENLNSDITPRDFEKDTRKSQEAADEFKRVSSIQEACLSWAQRSLDSIGSLLKDPGPEEASLRIQRIRKAAAKDRESASSIMSGDEVGAKTIIESMDTYGVTPRPSR